MREILFRAKTVHNPEWVEGYYDINYLGPIIRTCCGAEEINPETLSEFTGIFDKNGVPIYEHDILRADNDHIGHVVFHNGSFVKVCSCHNSINTFYGDNETIIGNIYDNPELLEENNG